MFVNVKTLTVRTLPEKKKAPGARLRSIVKVFHRVALLVI